MLKLLFGLCRSRITNHCVISTIKRSQIQSVFDGLNHHYTGLYFTTRFASNKKKGSKKSKMSDLSSSPEVIELEEAEDCEIVIVKKVTNTKRKTVAENLRENVLKWEASNASLEKKERTASISPPEIIEIPSSTEHERPESSASDFEIIEVTPPPPLPTKPVASRHSHRPQRPRLYSERSPLSKRNWSETPYILKLKKQCGGLPNNAFKFSVMSYNVLAQELLEQHPQLYQYHNASCLQWPVRHEGIMKEIRFHSPDVLCLQEVQKKHSQQYFLQPLKLLGYDGIYKQRTGDKCDGCAIFWLENKFEILEKTSVEFYQPGVDLLNRDNIGIIVRLKVRDSGDELVVASTHLLYNPRREDVRLAQMQLLLAEIDRVSHKNLPVILTGDFNLQPNSKVYELLVTGQLNLESRYGSDFVPPRLGITDCCRHSSVISLRQATQFENRNQSIVEAELALLKLHHTERMRERIERHSPERNHKFGTGTLSHSLQLKSVHEHPINMTRQLQEVTTHQDDWVTVDYIFYSNDEGKKEPHKKSLRLLARWSLPTVEQCQVSLGLIPNFDAPSDHLPLVACFALH